MALVGLPNAFVVCRARSLAGVSAISAALASTVVHKAISLLASPARELDGDAAVAARRNTLHALVFVPQIWGWLAYLPWGL